MSPHDKKMQALKEFEERKNLLKDYLHGGHRKPQTRREFLASGFLSFASTVMAPNLLGLVSNSAWAQTNVCPQGSNNFPAFINIQLAGGPAMFANHLVCRAGGTRFDNYTELGMGSIPVGTNYFSNNAPFWGVGPGSNGSPMMNKMLEVLANDMDVLSNTAFVAICAASIDDTTDNQQDLSGIFEKAGIIGTKLPYTLTTGNVGATISNDTVTSKRFKGAIFDSANLLSVDSSQTLANSLGFSGALGSFPGNENAKLQIHGALAKLIEDLNKYQVEQIAREPNSHESQKIFRNLVTCAVEKNASILGQRQIVDIFDPDYGDAGAMATVFDPSEYNNNGLQNTIRNTGHTVASCLSGLSGGAIITLGGYDYHNGRTRQQANQKDAFAGDVIARVLLAAKRKNRKTFIFVSADGSVSTQANDGDQNVNWQGDLAQRGMGYMIAYDPAGPPNTAGYTLGSYSDAPFQLNHFDSDFRVATVNPISSIDANELYTCAVFLNYLNFAGQSGLIDSAAMKPVKTMLLEGLPSAASNISDYFTRIKS